MAYQGGGKGRAQALVVQKHFVVL